jgi:(R,R)-butanediol dehydrogenase/meso-butanediol dehydrogenase/diacetyl reductase
MRAAVYQGVDTGLVLEDVPDPVPGPLDVVLKVERCGICGSDVHMTDGVGVMECPAGIVLGHEYAGEVVDVGEEISAVAVGDRVTALAMPGCGRCEACRRGHLLWCTADEADKVYATGAYSEYVRTVGSSIVRLPADVDYSNGALVEPLAVALHGVTLSDVREGDSVTIIGAGPIALSTLAWLRAKGVDDVTVVATSARRERYAVELGATAFAQIDPVDPSTYPQDAAIVFEAAGTVGSIRAAFAMARAKGTVVSFGFCDVPDSFIPALELIKELRLQFSMMYNRDEFETTIMGLREGLVRPASMISDLVSLDELPEAFSALHGTNEQCKVMIDPWAPRS